MATGDERSLRQVQNLGIALAQSYAAVDPTLSTRAFAHLWRAEPHVTVQIGWAKHRFRDLALFTAADFGEIAMLRALAFEEAYNDALVERLTVAAEGAGAGDWLDAFVSARAASLLPSDQALALTVASFRGRNDQSDDLLSCERGRGFLGEVARIGRNRYRKGQHADHWLGLAAEATTRTEQWRLVQLATAASSRRHLLGLDPRLSAIMREIGGDMPQRLGKAAEKATKEEEKTLLGMRKPNGLLDRLMRG